MAAIVQNDDEGSIYYYTLSKGANSLPEQVGHSIAVVDFGYAICGDEAPLPKKFRKASNLLLGIKEPAHGKVWLDDKDIECGD